MGEKLKNMVHALRMKRISSGAKDGPVMGGGKKHLQDKMGKALNEINFLSVP